MKLEGQSAIIVGAGRGIGAAIARKFASEGARMMLVDLPSMKAEAEEVARAIAAESDVEAVFYAADCTDAEQVNRMINEAVRRFGGVDILVNSAGLRGPLVPVQDISETEWDSVLAVNLKAAFLCCKAVLKVMIEQKRNAAFRFTASTESHSVSEIS